MRPGRPLILVRSTLFGSAVACGLTTSVIAQLPAERGSSQAANETLFQSLDKNQDGQVTVEEVSADQRRFYDRLLRVGDKNEDGRLSRDEFIAALREPERPADGGPGMRPDPEQMQARVKAQFQKLDLNQDGKITVAEFPEPIRPRIQPLFERLGKDELTEEDFQRFAGLLGSILGAGPTGGPGGNGPDGPRRPFEPGQMFERFDQNQDGKLTRTEIPEPLRERLGRLFDATGKDELSREDFLKGFRELMANQPAPAAGQNPERTLPPIRIPSLLRVLDTNTDGKLSKEELSLAVEKFAELDLNGDGSLDLYEILGPAPRPAEGMTPGLPGNNPPGGGPLGRMDRDGDGKVSREEAPPRLKEIFDRVDQDSDGFLSPAELRRAFERGLAGRPGSSGSTTPPEKPSSPPEK